MRKQGISLDASFDLLTEIHIDTIDLNCVFLNPLNNAIRACKKLPENDDKKYIGATIKAQNPYVSIKTDEKGKIKQQRMIKKITV